MSMLHEGNARLRVVREVGGRIAGDGVELAYGFWPGRGMPIVAIHALTTTYKTFLGIGERPAGRRPLFAPDLRGRGDSDKPERGDGMAPTFADVPGHSVWSKWVEEYLAYALGQDGAGQLRPKAPEAGVRADFADMGNQVEVERRLAAVQAPIMVVRAECGLAPDQPGVLTTEAIDRIRGCCGPHVVEHTVADTTHYTIALADPGASTVAELLVEFAAQCGV